MQMRFPRVALLILSTVVFTGTPASADRRSDAKAQVAFGIRVAQSGLWKEALFRFRRAVELDPSYAAAWNNLAIVYEQTGEHDKAKEAYERALRLAPKNVLLRQNYELFTELHERMTKTPCSQPPC